MVRNPLVSMVALAAAFMLTPVAAEWAFSQNARQNAPAQPTPRNADGSVHWGIPGSPKGLWGFRGQAEFADPDLAPGAQRDAEAVALGRPTLSQVPWQPWTRATYDLRQENEFEPYTRCKPSGAFRQVATAYGTQLIPFPELQQFIIFQTGGPHSWRTIYMDGRNHPADLAPTYYGHSIGWFEGDTLVVDTVGYNERMWIANREGMPHSDRLHTIERFTRTDFNNIRYELTIDDPGAYTATWKTAWMMDLDADAESFEFSCQDNNKAHETMVGTLGEVDRTVPFVP
jgi:hypothetical protein